MKAVGVVRHLFYTSINNIDSSGTEPFDIYTCILYIYIESCCVVRHLFYTSKIQLIVLELNHLIYKHV